MEQIYHIRKRYQTAGESQRKIAEHLSIDRGTVAKYIQMDDFNLPVPIQQQRRKKTDAYRAQVQTWLTEDLTAPHKQRHTAHRVYKRLKEKASSMNEVLDISERSIRTLVASIKKELGMQEMVALPLLHPAGEAQVDFGETTFVERGVSYVGYHLCVTFPYSDAKYTQLFKGQNFECLAQGLMDIFQHIGGVPTVIRFDNMSTAVTKIKAQGEREITTSFRRLMCHFSFDSNFCNPASGHEKGSVENYVGTSRRNLFVPVPEMDDLLAYNKTLLSRCDEHLTDRHYKYESLVGQRFETDQAHFNPLPAYPFTACRYVTARTNHYGMVRLDSNQYSTAGHLRTTNVTLKIEAHHVSVLDGDSVFVVKHPRLYGKQLESMLWGPYLHVLAKRPRAHRYSGFFDGLPKDLRDFIYASPLTAQQTLLTMLADDSQTEDLSHIVKHLHSALDFKPTDVDSLIAAYAFVRNKPGSTLKNPVPEHLPCTPEYTVDFSLYGQLMGGDMRCQNQ